jgi:predicted dehydrogenase
MNTPIRVLQVGCGGITGAWFKAAQDHSDIQYVGLCDLNPAAAESRKAEFKLDAPVFTDLETALQTTKPDAVFDCTIPAAHTPTALLAFEHGAHVMSEKPLSDTLENAQRALAAAKAADRRYVVVQNYRYQKAPRRIQAFLQSGALGKITTVNADMYLGAHFGGFRDEMKHVLLLDMSIHTFDMGRFLSGANPEWVFCHEWNPSGSWYAHGASASAIFGMADGVVFNYRGSWCATGLGTGFNSHWRIVGEKGSLTWDGGGNIVAEVEAGSEGFFHPVEKLEIPDGDFGWKSSGHSGVMREFLDSMRGGPEAETTAFDNYHSLAMVLGAVDSADQGKRVTLGGIHSTI